MRQPWRWLLMQYDAESSLDKSEMGQNKRVWGACDTVHLLRHHQWGDNMTATRETRYTENMNGTANVQYHATTKAFIPTADNPSSDLSDEEILEMDNAGDSDTFPAQIIIDMIDSMLSTRRERTISWLQGVAAMSTSGNRILVTLKRIPDRPRLTKLPSLSK